MQFFSIPAECFSNAAVDAVVQALRGGGVVLMPTDTVYGLMVDAENVAAIEKLFLVKGRPKERPVQTLFAHVDAAEQYVQLDGEARAVAARFLPGALTLVVPKKAGGEQVFSGNDLVGVRIPAHAFCLAVAQVFGRPIAASSANVSGMPSERSVQAILAQLEQGGHTSEIAVVIDEGELPERPPTTVVEMLPNAPLRVLREGAISASILLDR